MGKYAKAIVAIAGAVLVTVSTFVSPDSNAGHIVTAVLAALGAVGVYAVPNKPTTPPAG